MNKAHRYIKIIEWSDEDSCYIGSCPELFYGGCHGDDPREVFAELCEIVDEWNEIFEKSNETLPQPLSGRDLGDFIRSKRKVAA